MGEKARELKERSKFDNEMIVGSEIRAALAEQQGEIDALADTFNKTHEKQRQVIVRLRLHCHSLADDIEQLREALQWIRDNKKGVTCIVCKADFEVAREALEPGGEALRGALGKATP